MKEYPLNDLDWITAKMYGKTLKKQDNDLPLSKSGIELFDELDEQVCSMLESVEEKLFHSKKELFWK